MSDDSPLATWQAARSMGKMAVPGELQLTRTHVIFEPKSKRAAGARFSVRLSFVAAVGTAPGTGKFFSGGKRERLCVTLGDGSEWLFVMGGLDDVTQRIRERLGGQR
ncbi:hypothetical protein [Gordonia neofelifaecis]|uniref:GRAM domain-containing protein n=1 Tax=Gordonia neofelifaecis NRRL B-59395 TaxID=644548 RepID=F1YL83_9ACTN|nr:hypothetical protein [Gordonia neofelifaecis]EGD54543.1 hypothetical protein SCNU_13213 [Gordonia neofelifaecis NRRL B-59395]